MEPKQVAIFGAGIAGLTTAHELSRLGHSVSVYESNPDAGGFFRSARREDLDFMPTEYSWHGMGPWYHNVFDLLKQIPLDETGSIYEKGLSRPIDFGIFPHNDTAEFYDRGLISIPKMFRMSQWEWAKWSWLMIKAFTAHQRSEHTYSEMNAAEVWKPHLNDYAYRTWRACFGPWIGSDWTRASLHTTGRFFRRQLSSGEPHFHSGDEQGPSWMHGSGNGWLLLDGPSSEVWFQPWVKYLSKSGVSFHFNEPLEELKYDGKAVLSARTKSGLEIRADEYVLAANPFTIAEILQRTPELEKARELALFKPLVQDGPHSQVSFRIAFSEPIHFPRERVAVIVSDSEFNITLFAQEQVWDSDVGLGKEVGSLWTATSCLEGVPGRIYGLPVKNCTKEQFIEEVRTQILACSSLDALVREANGGRGIADFHIKGIEVWHEWSFSPDGIQTIQPKWVTTCNTHPFRPDQQTSVPNLRLAGAHTKTEADVWSIEGAVESGRRAARLIDPQVKVLSQYTPLWAKVIGAMDDLCYAVRLPHVIDTTSVLLLVLFILAGIWIVVN